MRMARALGFGERSIFGRLALRPALNPVDRADRARLRLLARQHVPRRVDLQLARARVSYAADSLQSLDTPAIVGVTLFVALVVRRRSTCSSTSCRPLVDPRIRLR